jgi:uncharacterized protein (TIGR00730 family)
LHTPALMKKLRKMKAAGAYLRAYEDVGFLRRDDLRPVRLQLELLKPELALREQGITSTVVIFGSTRTVSREEMRPIIARLEREARRRRDTTSRRELAVARRLMAKTKYYDEARRFARIVSEASQRGGRCDYVVVTGGGPGIMEAAHRGAYDVGAKTIGLNITLPHEQFPNPYISPELCFQFHYFAIRKMHFMMRAKAMVIFPGGYGTLDELFEALTLVQTGKVKSLPVILFGRAWWSRLIDWEFLRSEGVIADEDLDLFRFAETAEEAWEKIQDYYRSRSGGIDLPSAAAADGPAPRHAPPAAGATRRGGRRKRASRPSRRNRGRR